MCIRTCVRRLKSNENLLPQPCNSRNLGKLHINKSIYIKISCNKIWCSKTITSKVHWNGFSPVWTSWWRFSLLDSTKALPHSAHTWTRGPWVCKCFLMAELSLNIFVQPLWGQGTVRGRWSLERRGRIRANSANCLGSDKSTPGRPSGGSFFPVIYSV